MKLCTTCGKALSRGNQSGYCLQHFFAAKNDDPEFRRKQREGVSRHLNENPEARDALRKRAKALSQDKELTARRTRHFVELRVWEKGAIASRDPEVRARAGRTLTERRLAWCPPHLRDDYRRLLYSQRLPAEEARRIILEQEAKERHRLRVKMGVADPDCEFNPEPYGPPCPDHLKPLMAASKAFRIPVGDIVRGTRSDRHVSRAKQAVMLALRKQGLSFPKIAPILNLKDHSTVIYGVKQAEYLASNDAGFARALAKVVAA